MNAPTNKTKAMLIATLLLGLGASALAGGTAPGQPTAQQAPTPQSAAPSITFRGQPAPAPTARPTAPAPGQAGPRGGHGPRGAGPRGVAPCAPGAGMAMRPAPGGPNTAGRAQPTPPAPGTAVRPTPPTSNSTAAAPKAPKGDKMDKGMGPKDKADRDGKGEVCPPAPRGMEQGKLQPGQATSNVAPAARDLGRLNALSGQTSDTRIRGYLNDARTYLQSASKAQQKAGRDLLHAAEALVQGTQTPQR